MSAATVARSEFFRSLLELWYDTSIKVPKGVYWRKTMSRSLLVLFVVFAASLNGHAQGRGGERGAAPPTARAAAPFDMTGYWVSIVGEDWRWRMFPNKGDYAGVPLNADGRKVADTWDPAKDEAEGEQCKGYGAPGIMRIPGRFHITWQDDQTLKIETDAGKQIRLFRFGAAPAAGADIQGVSKAEWELSMRTITLGIALFALLVSSVIFLGQAPAPNPGLGNPLGPMVSGTDFSGSWRWLNHQDAPLFTAAGDIADWGGIPLNDAARLYALSWQASRQTLKQQQCMGYVPPYTWMSPGNHRIWEERDPFTQRLTAIRYWGQIAKVDRTFYMDGRPPPPAYAPHTFAGFSTGKFEGNILTVTTTHIKRGWLRANGAPQSDAATVTEHLIRHGDTVTILAVVNDPVYLSEPMTKTSLMFRQPVAPDAWLYACDDSEQIPGRKNEYVPNHLFGQNPFVREYADKNRVPLLGAFGGRETLYPEFLAAVRDNTAPQT